MIVLASNQTRLIDFGKNLCIQAIQVENLEAFITF